MVGVLVVSGDISEYICLTLHSIQSEGAEVRKKLQGQVVTRLLWDNYAFIFIPSPVILPLDAQKKCLITLCPYLVYFELNRHTEGDAAVLFVSMGYQRSVFLACVCVLNKNIFFLLQVDTWRSVA